jgi:hypothetical protein
VAVQTCEGQSLSSVISELSSAAASTYCQHQTLEQENRKLKVMMQHAVSQLREKTATHYQLVDLLQSATTEQEMQSATTEQENRELKVMMQHAVSQLREKTDLLQSATTATTTDDADDSDKENSQRTQVDSKGREAYTNVSRAQLSYKKNKVQLHKHKHND